MSSSAALAQAHPRRLYLLVHFAFFLTGVAATMLGPLLPLLSRTWSLSDSQAGALFSLQALGSLVGIAVSTALLPRLGFLGLLSAGFLMVATGVIGVSSLIFSIGAGSFFVCGVGLGVVIPNSNVLTSEMAPGRRASALNILNSLWCVGAFVGPGLIAYALSRDSIRVFLIALAAALVVAAIWYGWESKRGSGRLGRKTDETGTARASRGFGVALLIGFILFLYVGVETATWGWIATYARRLEGSGGSWAFLQSAFWLALLIGRLVSPLTLRRFKPELVVQFSIFVVIFGISLLTAVTQTAFLMVAAAAAGFGMAAIYPTSVASFTECYGPKSAKAYWFVFSLAILGGAVVPWLVGLISDMTGSLRTAMLAPIALSLALAALQLTLVLIFRKEARLNR